MKRRNGALLATLAAGLLFWGYSQCPSKPDTTPTYETEQETPEKPKRKWVIEEPEPTPEGRIPIPRIVGVCYESIERLVPLKEEAIQRLELATNTEMRIRLKEKAREVYDFNTGYRIELVRDQKT